ncbi:hypothetical protein QE152_g39572 [Popillia japonica]|uniref:Reverse transcriptase n=1 Tax=Popillia japonica TaxID=7064 RepID=A0AAW1HTH8_POPJA
MGVRLQDECQVIHGYPSDHVPILLNLNGNREEDRGEPLLDFATTNWASFRSLICEALPSPRLPTNEEQLKEAVSTLTAAIVQAPKASTQTALPRRGSGPPLPPHYSKRLGDGGRKTEAQEGLYHQGHDQLAHRENKNGSLQTKK